MEIILREDIPHLGKAGVVVQVKDGYARNYLLPQGLAYPATEANKRKIAFESERLAKVRAAERDAAGRDAGRIAAIRLSFEAKVGEEGKLYGSVTAGDIHRRLEEGGFDIDKRQVELREPIRTLGEFKVPIKLHPEVHPEITVVVVPAPEA